MRDPEGEAAARVRRASGRPRRPEGPGSVPDSVPLGRALAQLPVGGSEGASGAGASAALSLGRWRAVRGAGPRGEQPFVCVQ